MTPGHSTNAAPANEAPTPTRRSIRLSAVKPETTFAKRKTEGAETPDTEDENPAKRTRTDEGSITAMAVVTPSSFDTLPDEILAKIVDYLYEEEEEDVDPGDGATSHFGKHGMRNLNQVSKRFYRIATPKLYQDVLCTFEGRYKVPYSCNMYLLLRSLLNDRSLGKHIKALKLHESRTIRPKKVKGVKLRKRTPVGLDSFTDLETSLLEYAIGTLDWNLGPKNISHKLCDAGHNACTIKDEAQEQLAEFQNRWLNAIKNKPGQNDSTNATWALIIALSHGLEELHGWNLKRRESFRTDLVKFDYVNHVIEGAYYSHMDAENRRKQAGLKTDERPSPWDVLPNLTKVVVAEDWESHHSTDPLLNYFMPANVKTVVLETMSFQPSKIVKNKGRRSNVKTLVWIGDAQYLKKLLKYTPRLDTLIVYGDEDEVGRAIKACQSGKLRDISVKHLHLVIDGSSDDDMDMLDDLEVSPVGTLTCFPNLTFLSLHIEHIQGSLDYSFNLNPKPRMDLLTDLPRKLKTINIVIGRVYAEEMMLEECDYTFDQLSGLILAKGAYGSPRLEGVTILMATGWDLEDDFNVESQEVQKSEALTKLKTLCEKEKVAFEMRYLSIDEAEEMEAHLEDGQVDADGKLLHRYGITEEELMAKKKEIELRGGDPRCKDCGERHPRSYHSGETTDEDEDEDEDDGEDGSGDDDDDENDDWRANGICLGCDGTANHVHFGLMPQVDGPWGWDEGEDGGDDGDAPVVDAPVAQADAEAELDDEPYLSGIEGPLPLGPMATFQNDDDDEDDSDYVGDD